jgi:hypothetical protein
MPLRSLHSQISIQPLVFPMALPINRYQSGTHVICDLGTEFGSAELVLITGNPSRPKVGIFFGPWISGRVYADFVARPASSNWVTGWRQGLEHHPSLAFSFYHDESVVLNLVDFLSTSGNGVHSFGLSPPTRFVKLELHGFHPVTGADGGDMFCAFLVRGHPTRTVQSEFLVRDYGLSTALCALIPTQRNPSARSGYVDLLGFKNRAEIFREPSVGAASVTFSHADADAHGMPGVFEPILPENLSVAVDGAGVATIPAGSSDGGVFYEGKRFLRAEATVSSGIFCQPGAPFVMPPIE